MGTLILYASTHGTTQRAASLIADHLGESPTVLRQLPDEKPESLNDVDTVLIGGSIHLGQIQAPIKRFCQEHESELLTKNLGLFLCYMDEAHRDPQLEAAFSKPLRDHATAIGMFGGEILMNKLNFLQKVMIRKATGVKESQYRLDEEAINRFASAFRNDLREGPA